MVPIGVLVHYLIRNQKLAGEVKIHRKIKQVRGQLNSSKTSNKDCFLSKSATPSGTGKDPYAVPTPYLHRTHRLYGSKVTPQSMAGNVSPVEVFRRDCITCRASCTHAHNYTHTQAFSNPPSPGLLVSRRLNFSWQSTFREREVRSGSRTIPGGDTANAPGFRRLTRLQSARGP